MATFAAAARSSVQPLVTFLAKRGVYGNAGEVGGSSVPTDPATLVSARRGDVAEVTGPYARTAAAVFGVHAQVGVNRGSMTGRGMRVRRVGTFAARQLVALKLSLEDVVGGVQTSKLGMFLDMQTSTIMLMVF